MAAQRLSRRERGAAAADVAQKKAGESDRRMRKSSWPHPALSLHWAKYSVHPINSEIN